MNKEMEKNNAPGLTLGIISLLLVIFTLVVATSIVNEPDFKIVSFLSGSSNTIIAFVLTIIPALFGIIGLARAIPAVLKDKSTKKIAATVLNVTALLLCIVQFIIVVSA